MCIRLVSICVAWRARPVLPRCVEKGPLLTGSMVGKPVVEVLWLPMELRLRARSWASACSCCSSRELGSMIALSSAYGRPRWRPRICIAIIMSFEMTLNWAEREVSVFGNPRLRPTVPYALTISKRIPNMEKFGFFMIFEPSAIQMMKKPKNMYHKSKDNWRLRWEPTYEGAFWFSSSSSSFGESYRPRDFSS